MPREVVNIGAENTVQVQSQPHPGHYKVVLVRAGVEPAAYYIPRGQTVGELLEHAGTNQTNKILTIGENRVRADRVLNAGEVLFVVPQPKNA